MYFPVELQTKLFSMTMSIEKKMQAYYAGRILRNQWTTYIKLNATS